MTNSLATPVSRWQQGNKYALSARLSDKTADSGSGNGIRKNYRRRNNKLSLAKAPQGWPNCLIYLRNHWGHDSMWPNTARNAIKGSCNVYFSHLADRIDPVVLQSWLFRFGYGRLALPDSVTTRGIKQRTTRPDYTTHTSGRYRDRYQILQQKIP